MKKTRKELKDSSVSKADLANPPSLPPVRPGQYCSTTKYPERLRSIASAYRLNHRSLAHNPSEKRQSSLVSIPLEQLSRPCNVEQNTGYQLPPMSYKQPLSRDEDERIIGGRRRYGNIPANIPANIPSRMIQEQSVPLPPIPHEHGPYNSVPSGDGILASDATETLHQHHLPNLSIHKEKAANLTLRASRSEVNVPSELRRLKANVMSKLQTSLSMRDMLQNMPLGQVERTETLPAISNRHAGRHNAGRHNAGCHKKFRKKKRDKRLLRSLNTASQQELVHRDSSAGRAVERPISRHPVQNDELGRQSLNQVRLHDTLFENVCLELAKILDCNGQSFFGSCRRSCCQLYDDESHTFDHALHRASSNEQYWSNIIIHNLAVKLQSQCSTKLHDMGVAEAADVHLANALSSLDWDCLIATVCSDLAMLLSVSRDEDQTAFKMQKLKVKKVANTMASRFGSYPDSTSFSGNSRQPLPKIKIDSRSSEDATKVRKQKPKDSTKLAVPNMQFQNPLPSIQKPQLKRNPLSSSNSMSNLPKKRLVHTPDERDTEFSSESLDKYLIQPRPRGHGVESSESEAVARSDYSSSNSVSETSTASLGN